MQSFFQNKIVRFVGVIIAVVVALVVLFFAYAFFNLFGSATGLDGGSFAPSVGYEQTRDKAFDDIGGAALQESAPGYYPTPTPQGHTTGLEQFETTRYTVNANTNEFDEVCTTLANLKAEDTIHFKTLTTSINRCNATFYVEEAQTAYVLETLNAFDDVTLNRNTESVTRHRQNIQSRTSILEQQLQSVSRSLVTAETQFDELADFARQANDAAALSEAIRFKLQNVDTLTQRKINLTSQLDNLYQQAADLEERLNVVEFNVTITRANPLQINQYTREWEQAWEELKDAANETLIGITAFFGIFILWLVRITIYLLVILVIIRALWKFVKLLWKKW